MSNSKTFVKKYRGVFVILAMAGIITSGHAQVVDREELERGQAPVTFVSSEGPHAVFNTLEEIRQIGVGLGQVIAGGATVAGELNRYFIVNAISPPEAGRLNADVFGVGSDALVNHIRNLRVIIQGYLQAAYGYSESDALLLAEFITIYNAVFRGNWEHFTETYRALVLENLDSERAGLSVHFSEWPGQTLMVIPLITALAGEVMVDAMAVANDQVMDELRDRDDMGIELRQDMVDLIEREAAEAEEQILAEMEAIADELEAIADELEAIAEEQLQLEETANGIAQQLSEIQDQIHYLQQQLLLFQQQLPGEPPMDLAQEEALILDLEALELLQQELEQGLAEQAQEQPEEIAAIEEELEELVQQEQELVQQLDDLAQQQEELADLAQQLLDEESDLEDRLEIAELLQEHVNGMNEWAQNELENIAEDLLLLDLEDILPYLVVTVEIERFDLGMGRLALVNPFTGQVVRRSPLDTVFAHTLTEINGSIFAIAGDYDEYGVVRLIEIDRIELVIINQTEQDISPSSSIWVSGDYIYAIMVDFDTEEEELDIYALEALAEAYYSVAEAYYAIAEAYYEAAGQDYYDAIGEAYDAVAEAYYSVAEAYYEAAEAYFGEVLTVTNHYLARFSQDLVLEARSEEAVHPNSNVIIQHGRLFTHRADGTAMVLDPITLEE
ncbi:MAG: hypothetical protein FWG66_04800 [Spirochaetes bacterium]|nr:hypothetical protein [Spirochaetota bacterium]